MKDATPDPSQLSLLPFMQPDKGQLNLVKVESCTSCSGFLTSGWFPGDKRPAKEPEDSGCKIALVFLMQWPQVQGYLRNLVPASLVKPSNIEHLELT